MNRALRSLLLTGLMLSVLMGAPASVYAQRASESTSELTLVIPTISYETFIKKYVNKRNPATQMYWRMDDVETDSKCPRPVLEGYLHRAQQHAGKIAERFGRAATEEQLLQAPYLSIEFADQYRLPHVVGVTHGSEVKQ